jgi:hypothetical protein
MCLVNALEEDRHRAEVTGPVTVSQAARTRIAVVGRLGSGTALSEERPALLITDSQRH